jgi:hypothetical protein
MICATREQEAQAPYGAAGLKRKRAGSQAAGVTVDPDSPRSTPNRHRKTIPKRLSIHTFFTFLKRARSNGMREEHERWWPSERIVVTAGPSDRRE